MRSDALPAENALQLYTLGRFRLEAGGQALTDAAIRTRKQWSVLCYLIAHRDREVPQTELLEVFWPKEHSGNPVSALRVLLHRVRESLRPLLGDGAKPIVSHRGAYRWSPAVPCRVDAERFEALCARAEAPELSSGQRMALCQEAVDLYRGDYLQTLDHHLWDASLAARYRGLYLAVVKAYALLLEEAGQFGQMYELCLRAVGLDPLNEQLQAPLLRSLLLRGKRGEALERYETFSQLLRQQGGRPPDTLRFLLPELTGAENLPAPGPEPAGEPSADPGPLVCEYEVFQQLCRLETRRVTRSGARFHVALLTLSRPDGGPPPLKGRYAAMERLSAAIARNLRRSDAVALCGNVRFAVLLSSARQKDCAAVMERVAAAFYESPGRQDAVLTWELREIV